MGAAAVPILLTVAGTAAQQYNANQIEERQNKQAQRDLQQQAARDREAEVLLNNTIGQVGASSPEQAKAAAMDQYLQSARRAQDTATSGFNQPGAVSDRYRTETEAAGAKVLSDAVTRGGQLAGIDAPMFQRQNEGVVFNRLGTDMGLLQHAIGSDAYLSKLRMQRASQGDPWLEALGSLAQGYGEGGGGFGISGGGNRNTGTGALKKSGTTSKSFATGY